MFDKILMPTDGSVQSLAAAERAVELARLARAPLLVAYVQEGYPYTGVGAASSLGLNEHLAEGQRIAAAAFEPVQRLAQAAGVQAELVMVEGNDPAERIVEAAHRNGADQIVMASRGRTGAARLLLGSVASKVVAGSQIPVLIVR